MDFTFLLLISVLLDRYQAITYVDHITTPINGSFILDTTTKDIISSLSGNTQLKLQPGDGNWVLYTDGAIWASGTSYKGVTHIEIASDGNIMARNASDILWETATASHDNLQSQPHRLYVSEGCAYLIRNDLYIIWKQGDCVTLPIYTLPVTSIDISVTDASSDNIPIALWYNSHIYHTVLPPGGTNTLISIPALTRYCPTSASICTEPCIMIENKENSVDAFVFDDIRFWISSNTWYGISGRCIDDLLEQFQPWLYDTGWSAYRENNADCTDGESNTLIAIDDEEGDSQPRKQILYFDTTRPNEYIMDALWSDATDVFPETYTCDPTKEPTEPSNSPSNLPTLSPSFDPSLNPTLYIPTRSPIRQPTQAPTINPTSLDAVMITKNYEIQIDINKCEYIENADGNSADCQIDADDLNEVIQSTLSINDNVQMLSTEIIDENLIIRLSITTGPENILSTDDITYHIEAQIDANDTFGDVVTEEKESKDDQVNDIAEDNITQSLWNIIIGSVAIVLLCCIAIGCYRIYKRNVIKREAQLVNMTSMSSDGGLSSNIEDEETTKGNDMNTNGNDLETAGDITKGNETGTTGDAHTNNDAMDVLADIVDLPHDEGDVLEEGDESQSMESLYVKESDVDDMVGQTGSTTKGLVEGMDGSHAIVNGIRNSEGETGGETINAMKQDGILTTKK